MKKACTNLGMTPGSDTTDDEIGLLYHAIQRVAEATGVDHRFILAVMMQESKGCVRVYTTANANSNPGLMQDHAGEHTCNPGFSRDASKMVKPCPQLQIEGMLQDGVGGTAAGAGLAELLNTAFDHVKTAAGRVGIVVDGDNAQVHYAAARQYNSDSVDYTNLDKGYSSTSCYVSDIVNRLTGWVYAPTKCTGG